MGQAVTALGQFGKPYDEFGERAERNISILSKGLSAAGTFGNLRARQEELTYLKNKEERLGKSESYKLNNQKRKEMAVLRHEQGAEKWKLFEESEGFKQLTKVWKKEFPEFFLDGKLLYPPIDDIDREGVGNIEAELLRAILDGTANQMQKDVFGVLKGIGTNKAAKRLRELLDEKRENGERGNPFQNLMEWIQRLALELRGGQQPFGPPAPGGTAFTESLARDELFRETA